MAQLDDEIQEILAKSRAERQALFTPVSELSRRLQPRHFVDVAKVYSQQKVTRIAGGVSGAVKANGGTAAAVALGAVAVFDAGRRSAGGRTTSGLVAETGPRSDSEAADAAPIRYQGPAGHGLTNFDRGKVLAASAGGLFLGHVSGQAFQPTAKERALFGKAAVKIQDAADKFASEHSRGAKLAAAQAFGIARYSAAFLAVLSAASDYLARSDKRLDTAEHHD
ncbi:hypothetical protein [Mesorhizobium loti]|uniref:hypothetical protein n=1 Tax=Rhizobium loti TaxID=381 RepID=UPI00047C2577|nr:hypothetical protein [Mesorhizobium loti]